MSTRRSTYSTATTSTMDPKSSILSRQSYAIAQFKKEPRIPRHLTKEHLVTGFGIHTHASLAAVLKEQQVENYLWSIKPEEEADFEHDVIALGPDASRFFDYSTATSARSSTAKGASILERKDRYLKELSGEEGEEEFEPTRSENVLVSPKSESLTSNLINGKSESMRKAQRYLRNHKIFEFFQFLIAHLLSAAPYDPIEFLLVTLDRCLMYRSGVDKPPLLYEKPHVERLFFLMDRMKTGYISMDQYETGLLTLGINPESKIPITEIVNDDELASKPVFVSNVLDVLTCLLDEMIRPRSEFKPKISEVPKAPPPSLIKA